MDYKQKYDNALERAKALYAKGAPDSLYLEEMFPELKESEDERTRKALIHLIKQGEIKGIIRTYLGVSEKDMLAWLKKQGEYKPIFRVGDYVRNKKTGDKVLIEQIDIANKVYYYSSCDNAAEIHSDFRFSKQNDWEIIGQNIIGHRWNEDDEDNLNSAIYYIRREPYRECDIEPIIDWLNSLKEIIKGK